eukprot:scaffold133348_cov80-Phaeocystis_antarctica.AAC.1
MLCVCLPLTRACPGPHIVERKSPLERPQEDMQATTKRTTAPADDGAPVSEEPAEMKINKQLGFYNTPVRTPQ